MATDIKKRITLGILFQETVKNHLNISYGHIRGNIIKVKEKGIENIGSFDLMGTRQTQYYSDLQIRCQSDETIEHTYAWSVEYYSPISVKYKEAFLMYKTLGSINKRLSKMEQEIGEPTSFTQFVLRAAKIIGVKWFVFNRTTHEVTDYRNMDLKFVKDVREAEFDIYNMERAIIDKVR